MTICNLAIIFIVRNCSVLLPKRVWRRKLCRLPRQKNVPRKLMQVTERQYRKESQCIEWWCCLCVWIRLLRRDRESHQAHQTLALRENSTGQELRTKSRRWGCITKQRKKDDVRAGSDIWAGGIWILRIRRDFDDLMLRLARVVALRFARIVASWEIIAVNPWVRIVGKKKQLLCETHVGSEARTCQRFALDIPIFEPELIAHTRWAITAVRQVEAAMYAYKRQIKNCPETCARPKCMVSNQHARRKTQHKGRCQIKSKRMERVSAQTKLNKLFALFLIIFNLQFV
jgi:hypothetical protein